MPATKQPQVIAARWAEIQAPLLDLKCRYRADGKPARGQPVANRLWGRMTVSASGCWEFRGSLGEDGYGAVRYHGKMVKAHRVAWMVLFGPLSESQVVCHHCDNPCCIRPSHLFVGTVADNNHDRHSKGRTVTQFVPGLDHPRAVLSEADKAEMRRMRSTGVAQCVIAERFKVSRGHVAQVTRGSFPKHRRGVA